MVEVEVVEVEVVEDVFFDMDEKFKNGEFSHFGQNAPGESRACILTHHEHVPY